MRIAMFSRIRPIADRSARVHAQILSPTAAEDMTRFLAPRTEIRGSRGRRPG